MTYRLAMVQLASHAATSMGTSDNPTSMTEGAIVNGPTYFNRKPMNPVAPSRTCSNEEAIRLPES